MGGVGGMGSQGVRNSANDRTANAPQKITLNPLLTELLHTNNKVSKRFAKTSQDHIFAIKDYLPLCECHCLITDTIIYQKPVQQVRVVAILQII